MQIRNLSLHTSITTSLLLLILCVSFFNPQLARAALIQTDVAVESIPDIPGPHQNVSLSLISYATDLNRAQINWFQNGSLKLGGFGEKKFSFETGGVGEITTIEIEITVEGSTLSKRLVIIPADVDLLWEATNTYAPPFYKGKILPSSEGVIKVIALPHFKKGTGEVDPGAVVYNWKRNYHSQQDASGYAKNVFTFKQSYLNPIEYITVTGIDNASGSQVKKTLPVSVFSPKILFYEKDPLLGVQYQQAVREVTLSGSEKTLIAEPYFFSPANIYSSDLRFNWKINGSTVATPKERNMLTLKSGGSGVSNISLEIKNLKKFFVFHTGILKINLQ